VITFLEPTMTPAASADRRQLVNIITNAFAADPPSRWIYPDADQYSRFFPRFVEVFGGRAIEYGSAYAVGDGAAALWLPPGVHVDEGALVALLEESVAEHRKPATFALFEEMASHHPAEPHWYLPLIGVLPSQQGHGYGSALLDHTLARCDEDGLAAYLEATTPRSVPLYRRHGFEVMAEIRVGSAPPVFPMVRQARRSRDPQIRRS
jgi:ribosomal protein S18 acetylase RimI-like enzyme